MAWQAATGVVLYALGEPDELDNSSGQSDGFFQSDVMLAYWMVCDMNDLHHLGNEAMCIACIFFYAMYSYEICFGNGM